MIDMLIEGVLGFIVGMLVVIALFVLSATYNALLWTIGWDEGWRFWVFTMGTGVVGGFVYSWEQERW